MGGEESVIVKRARRRESRGWEMCRRSVVRDEVSLGDEEGGGGGGKRELGEACEVVGWKIRVAKKWDVGKEVVWWCRGRVQTGGWRWWVWMCGWNSGWWWRAHDSGGRRRRGGGEVVDGQQQQQQQQQQ